MRCLLLRCSVLLSSVVLLVAPMWVLAENGVQTISYTKSATPLDRAQAQSLIQQYYNNHGRWAGTYNMKNIKSMRLQRVTASRVIAHVEYAYAATTPAVKHHSGTDRRTFVIIRHRQWSVVGMGRYMSGSL